MKSTLSKIISLTLMLLLSSNALALSSDRDQPAQIEADETEIDFKTGTRVLTNNVLVIQGTLRLKADKLVANYTKQGELVKAIANGSLARFKQRPDGQPKDVEGWGKKIIIDYPTNTLTLIGKAALKQGGSTARGSKIVYNMATDKLKIMGGSNFDLDGKNGSIKPKEKLKDPFADNDDQGPTETAPKTNNKPTKPNTTKEVIKPEIAPVKSGRSRLILQPRKKTDTQDK